MGYSITLTDRYNDECECCGQEMEKEDEIDLSSTIPYAWAELQIEYGIRDALLEPKKLGVKKAIELAPFLIDGLIRMNNHPPETEVKEEIENFNNLKKLVEEYLFRVRRHPEAEINVY